jgi:hypothetical protein
MKSLDLLKIAEPLAIPFERIARALSFANGTPVDRIAGDLRAREKQSEGKQKLAMRTRPKD